MLLIVFHFLKIWHKISYAILVLPAYQHGFALLVGKSTKKVSNIEYIFGAHQLQKLVKKIREIIKIHCLMYYVKC